MFQICLELLVNSIHLLAQSKNLDTTRQIINMSYRYTHTLLGERRRQLVRTSVSYSEGLGFKPRDLTEFLYDSRLSLQASN
jgi:hypothetical protein